MARMGRVRFSEPLPLAYMELGSTVSIARGHRLEIRSPEDFYALATL